MVAGGGSFLTLPTLIFLGLPAGEANGTNRLGVLAQNVMGVWGFHRASTVDWRWAARGQRAVAGRRRGRRLVGAADVRLRLPPPARPGDAGDDAVDVLARPRPVIGTRCCLRGTRAWWSRSCSSASTAGLIQAGVGFAVLAATRIAGMDLVQGNAVKVLAMLLLTVLSLAIFSAGGAVRWRPGLALGLGNVLGAMVGVQFAVQRGHDWIQRVVTVAVVAMADAAVDRVVSRSVSSTTARIYAA